MMVCNERILQELYPFAAIRGTRILRDGATDLQPFTLDAENADFLGRENVGVFIGGCGDLFWILDKIEVLATTAFPGVWVVALATKAMAAIAWNRQRERDGRRPVKHAPRYWESGSVVYTTPEGLRSYAGDRSPETQVAGVLLVDTLCHVHKARGQKRYGFKKNDRPQRIADFRADMTLGGWTPPFVVLTVRPAISVEPQRMLSPYCLDGWWFVDGSRLRVGRPPAASNCVMITNDS